MSRRSVVAIISAIGLVSFSRSVSAQWVSFNNETGTRLVAAPSEGSADPQEKDYAWGDVDKDGDIDLVCVRKQPFTSAGKRTNVLFMNEGGVLTDRTSLYATASDVGGDMGFLTATNDRDVLLVDLDGDTWLDIVTAVTISDGDPKHIGHPRIYINLQDDGGGNWQGFRFENNRIPTMLSLGGNPFNPRFCSVAAGDLTGDGKPELWFGDYDSSGVDGNVEPPGGDFDDRLLINDGNGFFTDQTSTRFSSTIQVSGSPFLFRTSAFGAAAGIADMNSDGRNDIIKQTALNPPQYIGVGYNNPANPGFFSTYESLYTVAPYFVTVGDLNNDLKADLVVTDDGTDRYLLNTGNGVDGLANFTLLTFPASTNDFGSQSVIEDLDNDGFNDVVISDVDVDIPPCNSRTADILRNNGNTPNNTFTADYGNIPQAMMVGVHNFAVFDINGDDWKDLVVGRCNSTEVWINQPPFGIQFTYPRGLPSVLPPDQQNILLVTAHPIGGGVLQPNTGVRHYRIDGGSWVSNPMQPLLGAGQYRTSLPAVPCAAKLDFYVTVQLQGGGLFTGPPGAPAAFFSAVAATGTIETVEDFEALPAGWSVVNEPGLTAGAWERVNPNGTLNGTAQAAPEDDAQAATDKTMCFVTGNGPPGGAVGTADVDGGPTRLISPAIDLTDTDATISYSLWAYSAGGNPDPIQVHVSNNGGGSWVQVESIVSGTASWSTHSFIVGDFFPGQPLTSDVRVRFSAGDTPNDSITEAGVDVFQVIAYDCTPVCACLGDFDADDKRTGLDVQSFVNCMIDDSGDCQCAEMDGVPGIAGADLSTFVDTVLLTTDCPD